MDVSIGIEELDPKDPFITAAANTRLQDDFTLGNDWFDSYVGLDVQIQASSPYENTETAIKPINNSPSIPIDDEDITQLSVRDLNKKIRSLALTKKQIQVIRKRRRSLKNREYALVCRSRRVNENEELEKKNKDLRKELKKLKDELSKMTKERDVVKQQYDKMKTYFNTLCTTSALSFPYKGIQAVPR